MIGEKISIVCQEFVNWATEEAARITSGESVPYHAVLCDPPYGIEFMGKDWDAHRETSAFQSWGTALLPLLHPGAIVFMFGGTRMWHRLAVGMEDAGFELWDTLMWMHGQGFPKAQAIDALIDKSSGRLGRNVIELKMALRALMDSCGKKRKQIDDECGFRATNYLTMPSDDKRPDPWINVLPTQEKWSVIKTVLGCGNDLDFTFEAAQRELLSTYTKADSFGTAYVAGEYPETEINVTRSLSPESAPWSGHKTAALKPAWEPVLCFKAPSGGRTYAEMAVEFGSGALNVDGGRIGIDDSEIAKTTKIIGAQNCDKQFYGQSGRHEETTDLKSSGRYPANLAFECICEKTEIVAADMPAADGEYIPNDQNKVYGKNMGGGKYSSVPGTAIRHTNPDCPAFLLDEQAGELTSGAWTGHRNESKTKNAFGAFKLQDEASKEGSTGGPSRFFYCAKASRSEREEGLYGFEEQNNMRVNAPRENEESKTSALYGNDHPTVKPVDLAKWLAGLLLPAISVNPRRLLIPFLGSGSEAIGAALAGWDQIIGIEQDKHYCEIAQSRIAHWAEIPVELQSREVEEIVRTVKLPTQRGLFE